MSAPPPGHALVIGIDRYPGFPPENQLDGCVHDARLMARLLRQRFAFPNPRLLLDAAATRAGILEALEELLEATGEGHRVVLHFSGHGSQMRDREGDEPDGYDETLVPYDSGRGSHPNRDISDDEIHHWLLSLTRRTDAVTLIFDCCHSATLSRDPLGFAVRRVDADHRPVAELPPSPVTASPKARLAGVRSARPCRRGSWASLAELGDRYTLLSACRDDESAYEHRDGSEPHGALTFFLGCELQTAPAGSSYRQIFQRLAPRITARYPLQHPQLEGARDRQLFGVNDLPGLPPIQDQQLQARFFTTLAVDNRDRNSALAGRVELRLHRRRQDGSWEPLALDAGDGPCLPEGTRLGIEVHNHADQTIYPALLDFGLTGRISVLYPVPGSQEPLPPGGVLRLGMRPQGAALHLQLPPSTQPAESGKPRHGTERIKLFATTQPADFSCLRQPPWRSAPPSTGSPADAGSSLNSSFNTSFTTGLQHLLHLAGDWATVTHCFEVREAPASTESPLAGTKC
ncbi:MAG: caspase family protein [Acidobacteriota bacterium]|nr:caspase family protein [Acidobacteriota bacterium]